VITGSIEILQELVTDSPQLAHVAKLIAAATERGAVVTSQLLAFSRQQPLQPRAIDINGLMVDTTNFLCPTLGAQIEIESRLEDGAWPVLVDPNQFTTALLNLAINARDAMPGGGRLTLATANVTLDKAYAKAHDEVAPGEYVMIAIADTGSGIPPSIRDRVFEPFFTTKSEGKGTGLGLSMVYGFVKQSGGHIRIHSEEGLGTRFEVYLPKAGAPAQQPVDVGEAAAVEGGSETILVVEDDVLVRNQVIAQLQSLGYVTLSATNAREGLALTIGGADFDLLLTDVIMPGRMNGRELAEELVKRRPSLKVLFTSGYSENALVHHGRLDAGVLLLPKPYKKSDLARMVRLALDGTEASARPAQQAECA
jgi:CheY-like chemotaxis protein